MVKVYLQAAGLAILGLGIAVADRTLRPTPTVESPGGTAPSGPTPRGPTPPPNPSDGSGTTDSPSGRSPDPAGKPTPPPPNPTPTPASNPTPAPTPPVPKGPVDVATLPVKLPLADAYALFSQGATFIDGRKPEEYAAGHVRDATNLRNEDVQQNNQAWQDFFQTASLDGGVYVVYCYGKDCHEAEQLRDTLAAVGFKKVFVMEASLEEWKQAGYPAQ